MNHKLIRVLLGLCLAGTLMAGCSQESKKAKIEQRAEAYLKAGDYDRAELEYKNLLRLDPTNRVALRNLGVMFYEQGRLRPAFELLSHARKIFPDDVEVRVKYAMLMLPSGQAGESRDEALQLLALQPTNQDAMLLLVDSSRTSNQVQEAQQYLTSLPPASREVSGYHVAWGMLQLRRGNTNTAAESFRTALTLDPKSSVAHMALGGVHVLGGDTNGALAEFKAAADFAPARSFYPIRLADLLVGLGDVSGAKERLEQVSKATPDYLPALMRLAQLALAERRFPDCEGALKAVFLRDPVHLEGMVLMARLWMAQDERDKAIAELERMIKYYPRLPLAHFQMAGALLMQKNDLAGAVRSLNEALAISPEYPEAILLLAELNIRRGNTALATESLTKLVERMPGLTAAQLLLATAHRAAGKWDAALAIYDKLSRNYPTNPQPALLMGMVQRQQKQNVEARKSFEAALRFVPDFIPAVEQLINLDLEERRFAEAQARAQREVDRAPTNTAPYLLLANVHLAQTNRDAAEKVLLQALERTPESGPVNTLLARIYVASQKNQEAMTKLQGVVSRNTNDLNSWLMIAELHSAASNYVAAGKAYDAILAVDPRHGPALNNLAWLCSEYLQEPNRAYELASRARELNPGNSLAAAATADTLGWVLFKNGDYVRALALLQESARVLSEQPDVLFHLGMTHYMMGEEPAARVALQSAIQLASPDALWRAEAAERLRILDFDPATATAAAVKEMANLSVRSNRDPIVLARLGAVSQREGDWKQAATAYENALQVNTNLVPVMVNLAQLYSSQIRNPERAFALARQARNLEPGDPKIAHTLGRLAYGSAQSASDFQWAHGLLQESARALPDDPEVQFDLASAAYAVGDVTNAMSGMQKVVGLKATPSRLEEATRFLEMNKLLRRPEEATASASKVAAVLQKEPDYVPALCVNGILQELKRDFPGARDTYERILKIRPLFAPAHRSLALIYATHLNDLQKAYDHATKARASYPQDPQVSRLLGSLEYQRGEFPRAVQLLKESAPAFPQDAELFYTLGMAHYKLKQSRECKDALTKAVGLSPNSPQATEAKRVLAELK